MPVLVDVLVQHLPRPVQDDVVAPEVAARFEAALRRLVEDGWSVPQVARRLAALQPAGKSAADVMLAHLESGDIGTPSERELAATRSVLRNHRRAALRAEEEEQSGPPASPAAAARHLADLRALLADRRPPP